MNTSFMMSFPLLFLLLALSSVPMHAAAVNNTLISFKCDPVSCAAGGEIVALGKPTVTTTVEVISATCTSGISIKKNVKVSLTDCPSPYIPTAIALSSRLLDTTETCPSYPELLDVINYSGSISNTLGEGGVDGSGTIFLMDQIYGCDGSVAPPDPLELGTKPACSSVSISYP